MVFVFGTLFFILFAGFVILFIIQYKQKQVRHYTEKLELEHIYKSQILQTQLEVQEQSFRYFSEEIHDNVGQLLSLVKMQLYQIKNNSTEPQIIADANNSTEILGKAITDLRNISHTLNNTFINSVKLAAAIEKELIYINSARSIKCTLYKSGDEYDLGDERELLIFRIVQESISNAIKHGRPTAIDVYLSYEPGVFSVKIKDNGEGFDTENITSDGIGLNNMNIRAKMLNGKFNIQSIKDLGTFITLEIEA